MEWKYLLLLGLLACMIIKVFNYFYGHFWDNETELESKCQLQLLDGLQKNILKLLVCFTFVVVYFILMVFLKMCNVIIIINAIQREPGSAEIKRQRSPERVNSLIAK